MGPPPGYHQHDGFYVRLTAGIGGLRTNNSVGGVDQTTSGGGPSMTFAFGGAMAPNVMLYGEMLITGATNPQVDYAGTSRALGYDLTLFGIGPGVAYYFMPSNVYLSGTLAFSQVAESTTDNSSSSSDSVDVTKMGIGASFMVGKEWWVSSNWGLGVAGLLHVASMRMMGDDSRMTATALSLLFSATYN